MKRLVAIAAIVVSIAFTSWSSLAQTDASRVSIRVDATKRLGPMTTMWAFFGHDEPNYTYMTDGRKLLSELAALSPVPVNVRVHNLLTT